MERFFSPSLDFLNKCLPNLDPLSRDAERITLCGRTKLAYVVSHHSTARKMEGSPPHPPTSSASSSRSHIVSCSRSFQWWSRPVPSTCITTLTPVHSKISCHGQVVRPVEVNDHFRVDVVHPHVIKLGLVDLHPVLR